MPLILDWREIGWRLFWTVVAGAVVGLNRGEHGRPAGLRTTLLVTLAASISMIQVNLLLPLAGKPHDSFIVMDLMRLPLGILTGVGFIGAGAILRKDNLIMGVTTAATLWFATVMGLCLGGGQTGLGLTTMFLGIFILWVLKHLEGRLKHGHHATLTVLAGLDGPTDTDILDSLKRAGFGIGAVSSGFFNETRRRQLNCELNWHCPGAEVRPPPLVTDLAREPGVISVEWKA